MIFQKPFKYIFILVLTYLLLVSPVNHLTAWETIQERGYISWITRPSPLTFYTSLDGVIGLEHDILNQFCIEQNLELRIITANTSNNLFTKFNENTIDIAGANLTLTPHRQNNYLATVAYDQTNTILVSSLRNEKIKSLKDIYTLSGITLTNSSYTDITDSLEGKYNAKITQMPGKTLYELLQMVAQGSIDYTIADSNIFEIYKLFVPALRIGFSLSENNDLVFLLPHSNDASFKNQLDNFIKGYIELDQVSSYKSFIANTLPNSKPADTIQFIKNYEERWPQVKNLIYFTAEKYKIPAVFLGAIAYQESHWNAQAVSPTLVKGLMMLTKNVAQEQNVSDRTNPLQSLEGGAKHYLKMLDIIPDRIIDPNKTSFALASYNIGYGNLEKARVLTQKDGKNPDLWVDVKQYLPLLNGLPGEKVDGRTAVRYVENIFVYQNLLQWKEQQ